MASQLSKVHLPIETPRLTLRLPSWGDLPALRRSFRDPRTARAAGAAMHPPAERKDPALRISRTRREYRRGEHLSLSVLLRDSPVCIGRVGLRGLDRTRQKVESLSYWIDPRFWNLGYATEASWHLCEAAFRELGMRRIGSSTLDRNFASLAVLQRLGFVRDGREREAVRVKGRVMDMVLFGMLERELPSWERVSQGGEASRSAPLTCDTEGTDDPSSELSVPVDRPADGGAEGRWRSDPPGSRGDGQALPGDLGGHPPPVGTGSHGAPRSAGGSCAASGSTRPSCPSHLRSGSRGPPRRGALGHPGPEFPPSPVCTPPPGL